MNYLQTIKYSLYTTVKNLSPFYIALAFIILMYLVLGQNFTDSNSKLGSWDLLAIFVASGIAGCFKERFHFFLQQGYSRKTLFLIMFICIIITVIGMAIIEEVIVGITSALGVHYDSMYSSLYAARYVSNDGFYLLDSILWHSCFNLAAASVGFLISTSFYRLSKMWKIIIFAVIPSLLIFGAPLRNYLFFDGQLLVTVFKGILKGLGLYQGANPYIAMITTTCISLLALLGTFLVVRRLNVKKQ